MAVTALLQVIISRINRFISLDYQSDTIISSS